MRIIYCDNQYVERIKEVNLNSDIAEDSLDDEYVKCLEHDRKTSYYFISRPDCNNRNAPQPDYLFREGSNLPGKLITIEYTRIFESEQKEKRTAHVVKELEKRNIIPYWWIEHPTPQELGDRLNEFFS